MIKIIKQFSNNKSKLGYIFLSVFFAFFMFPAYFVSDIYPVPDIGSLDPSWSLTLNYANFQNLIWGKDFAFTYGPLSYLAIKTGWNCNKYAFLFFDLFYFLNVFFLFYKNLKNNKNTITTLLFILTTIIIIPEFLGGATALVLFFLLLFWIKNNLEKTSYINYTFQIIIVCLLFFIKFNTGLLSFLVFSFSLIYMVFFKLEKLKTALIYFFIPIILIVIFSQILNVSLIDYIHVGIDMVDGYNNIMYIRGKDYDDLNPIALLLIGISTLLFAYKIYLEKNNKKQNIFLFVLFLGAVFVLYKQAFVRADLSHIFEFFLFFIFLHLCVNSFFEFSAKSATILLIIPLLAIPVYIVSNNHTNFLLSFKYKIDKSIYLDGFFSYTPTSTFNLFPNNNQLPQSIKDKVKQNKIDVYPWNIHLLYQNKLNYSPRPVIQSYTAYTKYLEDLNFDHYNSKSAPQFVLYDYTAIDYRYPLFDEPKVNLSLLKNYKVIESFIFQEKEFLLLEKKSNFEPIILTQINEYALLLNSPLIPKKDHYYEIDFYYSTLGNIKSFFDHAPSTTLLIKTKNNRITEYKTSKFLLKSGLFLGFLIENTNDFKQIMTQDTISKEIKSYNFRVNENHFKDKIRIKEYKITQ